MTAPWLRTTPDRPIAPSQEDIQRDRIAGGIAAWDESAEPKGRPTVAQLAGLAGGIAFSMTHSPAADVAARAFLEAGDR